MARFLDDSPEYQPEEGEELTPIEEPQVPEEEQPAEPEEIQEAQDEAIPEKYQGKDIKDIVQMHQEAEKLLGKQSSEVGELRKIVDDFVKTQIEKANSPQEKEDEEIDFFENPQQAVERAIAKHPKIKEAETLAIQMKQAEILNKLQTNHPDFKEVIQDEKFLGWVGSSKIRSELYQRADKEFHYDSADELLSLWKERQSIVKETADMQDADRKRQLKAASTGSTKGSGEKPSRKIYRRADIIKLMRTDPNRYQDLVPEIRQAYAEGRVK